MPTLDRREFLKLAAALGASLAWGCSTLRPSSSGWRERRELFPHGVASGDPDANSVLLWTRRPYNDGRERATLLVEVATDPDFQRVIATTAAPVLAAADWTCRVLVADLPPAGEFWYRFVDEDGNGSRIGRTLTAPAPDDPRPAKFAFVSCQSAPEGAMNAYRRMIYEDERAAPEERLGFVLHLGDFVYEVIQTPDQVKDGHRYDRKITFPVAYKHGRKVANDRFTVPGSLDDYRALYKGYLVDPDLQDARARWPFVCIWDNHEFSWLAWQSIMSFPGEGEMPGQKLKVAANQAWFEYQPMRVAAPGQRLDRFDAPVVSDVAVTEFDDNGLGLEPNNLTAIESLIVYRALRWGRHIDLILTDQRAFRGKDYSNDEKLGALFEGVPYPFFPEALSMQVDSGREYAGGHPPAEIVFGAKSIPNYRIDGPPQSMLGAKQKAWFLERLRNATATWKIWGTSLGTHDQRVDPQNLPDGLRAEGLAEVDRRLRRAEQRRLGRLLPRARRDLRHRARPRHHRLRHPRRRPPQLLGRLRREVAAAARQVRARRRVIRRRLDHLARRPGSQRARQQEEPAAQTVHRRPPRRHDGAHDEPDAQPRRALRAGVRRERRPGEGACREQPGARAAPGVRGPGRAWLRNRARRRAARW